jgi:hypothetical protein
MVLRDVGRVELGEDGDLGDDVVNFIVGVFDVDDLDGDGLTCTLIETGRA